MEKVIARDITTQNIDRTSQVARISFVASVTSLLSLVALHVLSPEFDPSWRMVSEYALGSYSWVLALMFITQALSSFALFFAIKNQVRTVGGNIGQGTDLFYPAARFARRPTQQPGPAQSRE